MKKWTLPLALATVAVYLTLSFSAAACLLTHQAYPSAPHHHGDGAAHSLLCAWACQVNQPVDGLSAAPELQPLALAVFVLVVASIRSSLFFPYFSPSRAPPRF
ncbi:hypothetical protein [Nitrospira lenta]|uniref:Uncharacterized protein n=1 Tax=Nitrospira lenta TaxID=1436998 RepID=A0A330L1U8_9BACT|nr:hypothetical protein [Nitrospira lenta]SPP63738.1 conserved exported hypothetical protein [Nitrospira lenta]